MIRVVEWGKEFIEGQEEPVLFVESIWEFEEEDEEEALEFGVELEAEGKYVLVEQW